MTLTAKKASPLWSDRLKANEQRRPCRVAFLVSVDASET